MKSKILSARYDPTSRLCACVTVWWEKIGMPMTSSGFVEVLFWIILCVVGASEPVDVNVRSKQRGRHVWREPGALLLSYADKQLSKLPWDNLEEKKLSILYIIYHNQGLVKM